MTLRLQTKRFCLVRDTECFAEVTWVLIDQQGYMYFGDTLFSLVVLATLGWEQDENLAM